MPLTPEQITNIGLQTQVKYPRAFSKCHVIDEITFEPDPEAWDFIILYARECNKLDATIGCNGKRTTNELSFDALFIQPNKVIDVVGGAGGPNPFITYNDVSDPNHPTGNGKFIDPFSRQTYYNYNTTSNTLLGVSMFPAWAMMRNETKRFEENLMCASDEIGATVARWFFTLGDNTSPGQDPWSIQGAWFNDPQHLKICRDVMATFRVVRMKSHLVLCGGLKIDGTASSQFDTEEKRNAIVDRAAILINEHPDEFVVCSMINEWEVNGAARSWLRNMARRLRDQVPEGFPITLSTPMSVISDNSTGQQIIEEYNGMYGGDSGANTLTIHSSRPNHTWNPLTVRGLGISLPIIDGEPRGPGASSANVTNPAVLLSDLNTAKQANAKLYNYHPLPGIWFGKCDPRWPSQNVWANYWDVPTHKEICKAFNGSVIPMPHTPHPYEQDKVSEVRNLLEADYARAGHGIDGGIIDWSEQTMIDYYNGMTWEDSVKKHRGEWCAALGIPVPVTDSASRDAGLPPNFIQQ